MPFSIRKIGKNKYQVYNTATGEIHSKGTSKKKAEGQFRLLQGVARKEVVGLEGGAKRSRTEAQWVAERNRVMERLDALANRLEELRHEDAVVVSQLPNLPPELLGGNSQFVMKYEIYGEFISSEALNRDMNYNNFSPHQRTLIYQWLNTIPHSITRDFLERDRLEDELIAELDEEEYDLDDIRNTRARENTMAPEPDDEQTEKEGYGRRGLKGGAKRRRRPSGRTEAQIRADIARATELYRESFVDTLVPRLQEVVSDIHSLDFLMMQDPHPPNMYQLTELRDTLQAEAIELRQTGQQIQRAYTDRITALNEEMLDNGFSLSDEDDEPSTKYNRNDDEDDDDDAPDLANLGNVLNAEIQGLGRRGGGQYSTASPEYQPRRFL